MKIITFKLTIFFLIVCNDGLSQNSNQVQINKTGDNSKVIIVQNGDYKAYNISNPKEFNALINEISKLSKNFKTLFDSIIINQNKQYKEVVKRQKRIENTQVKTNEKLNDLPKKILDILFTDSSLSILKLESNIKELENNKRKLEGELLVYRNENPSFKFILDSANFKLKYYDFEGYHKVMESYIQTSISNAANGCFWRAKTYQTYYYYADALTQMERASLFDTANIQYFLECASLAAKIRDSSKQFYYYNKVLANSSIDPFQKVEVLQALGRLYIYSDLNKSHGYLKEAENTLLFNISKDTTRTIVCLILLKNSLGELSLRMGKTSKAIEEFKFSIGISNIIVSYKDNILTAITYRDIGLAYNSINQFDSCIFYLEKALEIFNKHGLANNYDAISRIENQIGLVHLSRGSIVIALDYLTKAAQNFETYINNNHPDAGIIQANLGFAYLNANNKQDAKTALKKAKEILTKYYSIEKLTLEKVKEKLIELEK